MSCGHVKILTMVMKACTGQDAAWQQAEVAMAAAMLCIGAKNGAAVLQQYRCY